ncbi:MAG: ADP-ribosylglycohydrolase family protein, partial [Verrucomicrobiota bacterium]
MPAHWIYELKNLRDTFDGGVQGFEAAPHPHPESFMVGMGYHPDVPMANRLGRPYDILHNNARFYNTSYSELQIATGEREEAHGNATPKLEDRYHYHHGLGKGENTVAAHLVRVMMRSVIE